MGWPVGQMPKVTVMLWHILDLVTYPPWCVFFSVCVFVSLSLSASRFLPVHLTVYKRIHVEGSYLLLMCVFVKKCLSLCVPPCPHRGACNYTGPPSPQQRTVGSPSWLLGLQNAAMISVIPSNLKPYPDVLGCIVSVQLNCSSTPVWKLYISCVSVCKRNYMAASERSVLTVTHFCCFGPPPTCNETITDVKVVTLKGNSTNFTHQSVFTDRREYYSTFVWSKDLAVAPEGAKRILINCLISVLVRVEKWKKNLGVW